MNRLPWGQVKSNLLVNFELLRQQRFFKDRLSLAIIIPTLVLNAITIFWLLAKLRPTESLVPVHYSSLVGFDRLGPWFQSYSIGIFAAAVTLINAALAALSFSRSRITSFVLSVGSFVVALFCLIISLAFASIA